MSDPAGVYTAIRDEVQRVLIGNEEIVEGLTIALLSDGHVLLEGVPGIAKTTAAQLFARASGLDHTRIQMTPDVLPADITGTNIYRESTGEFETRKGPIFSNIVLADEINRATPKTQSALLEAMAEKTVSIEGDSYALPAPFLLVATQNPIEMEGTFVLPAAQRDRFQQKLTMNLPRRENEREMIDRFGDEPTLGPDAIEQVVRPDELLAARDAVAETYIDSSVKSYLLDLVRATRDHEHVEHGASARGSLAFLQAGKARAAIHGREYVIPDDIKTLAHPILVHRIILNTDAEISGVEPSAVVDDVLSSTAAPDPAEATGSTESADGRQIASDGAGNDEQ